MKVFSVFRLLFKNSMWMDHIVQLSYQRTMFYHIPIQIHLHLHPYHPSPSIPIHPSPIHPSQSIPLSIILLYYMHAENVYTWYFLQYVACYSKHSHCPWELYNFANKASKLVIICHQLPKIPLLVDVANGRRSAHIWAVGPSESRRPQWGGSLQDNPALSGPSTQSKCIHWLGLYSALQSWNLLSFWILCCIRHFFFLKTS